ncbi:MAG TPA: low molecular weight protein-tyrosine-phosphatase [Pseudomonadales bacterium]|nr:low molecular weight protein-tyrosine-phosphatase [Pseudomonadales bacterium]
MKKVLFVCLGNICRSPTAEGVFKHKVNAAGLASRIISDSAGTAAYHVGEPPDKRSIRAAAKRGYDLSSLRARKFERSDFQHFDYILAMDNANYSDLYRIGGNSHPEKLKLFLEFHPDSNQIEVPDPYYGGEDGFNLVLDLCERAADSLLDHLRRELA